MLGGSKLTKRKLLFTTPRLQHMHTRLALTDKQDDLLFGFYLDPNDRVKLISKTINNQSCRI